MPWRKTKVSDTDAVSCDEGMASLIQGGTGFHPHPPPIKTEHTPGPRTAGPRPEPLPREGRPAIRRIYHAAGEQ
jgi:hypothetical protein